MYIPVSPATHKLILKTPYTPIPATANAPSAVGIASRTYTTRKHSWHTNPQSYLWVHPHLQPHVRPCTTQYHPHHTVAYLPGPWHPRWLQQMAGRGEGRWPLGTLLAVETAAQHCLECVYVHVLTGLWCAHARSSAPCCARADVALNHRCCCCWEREHNTGCNVRSVTILPHAPLLRYACTILEPQAEMVRPIEPMLTIMHTWFTQYAH